MNVPFLDLAASTRESGADLIMAAQRVIDSSWFILGREVEDFEHHFADYCDAPSAVGVGNGLEALALALRSAGIGPGDEVIVPSNTFIATWLAVSHVGASVVPVEPDFATFNIDPSLVEAAITEATRAIIPVHLYGQPADLDPLRGIAERHGLIVIEDAAQAHGARYKGRRIGSGEGSIAAWSFYPGKNLGALGDGGAITCSSSYAEQLRCLRNYGSIQKYHHREQGFNSRLDELQAAFLKVKLKRLDRENERRRDVASRYTSALQNSDLILPSVPEWADPVWHLYVVRHPERDRLAEHLSARGIATVVHYPIPPHLQGAYRDLGWGPDSFPVSERMHREVLSLPMGPFLSDEAVDYVSDAVLAFS